MLRFIALYLGMTLPAFAAVAGGVTTGFSPDGSKFILTATYESPPLSSKVSIRDTATGGEIRTFVLNYGDAGSFYTPVVAQFSPDGKTIAMSNTTVQDDGSKTFVIDIYDVNDGHLVAELGKSEHFEVVSNLLFTPDGSRLIATVGYWNHVRNFYIYDIAAQSLAMSPGFPTNEDKDFVGPWGLHISPKLDMILIENLYGGVDLWSLSTGKYIERLHPSPGGRTYLFPDQKRLLVTSIFGAFSNVFDLKTQKSTPLIPDFEIHAAAISPDGKHIALGADDGTSGFVGKIEILDIKNLSKPQVLWANDTHRNDKHSCGVESIQYSPDGKLIAVNYAFGYTRMYDAASGAVLYEIGQP